MGVSCFMTGALACPVVECKRTVCRKRQTGIRSNAFRAHNNKLGSEMFLSKARTIAAKPSVRCQATPPFNAGRMTLKTSSERGFFEDQPGNSSSTRAPMVLASFMTCSIFTNLWVPLAAVADVVDPEIATVTSWTTGLQEIAAAGLQDSVTIGDYSGLLVLGTVFLSSTLSWYYGKSTAEGVCYTDTEAEAKLMLALDNKTQELAQNTSAMSVLEGELASFQKSVADQKTQLKATMEGYEGQLKATTAKIGKLAAVEQELDAKKRELKDVWADLQSIQQELHKEKAAISTISEKAQAALSSLESSEESKSQLAEKTVGLERQLAFTMKLNGQTKADLAKTNGELAKAQAEEAKAHEELAKLKKDLTKVQPEAVKLKEELAKAQNEASKAKAEAAKTQDEASKAQADVAKVQADAAKAQDEASKAKAEAAKAQADVAKAQADVAKA
eukprot:CAMPEP_0198197984 /NCGR_PEP_ID=MMETSP1445-20131203/1523_1 /TAXON_ID=36898 /ORGANISM="Pyramimonas sp., Strain CCMP2087" /LENGTH=444 /DNA_ID=CAMNT_0043867409 /DNA_START=115 /DNA_END=1445 /DNA_ORIENTATION=+